MVWLRVADSCLCVMLMYHGITSEQTMLIFWYKVYDQGQLLCVMWEFTCTSVKKIYCHTWDFKLINIITSGNVFIYLLNIIWQSITNVADMSQQLTQNCWHTTKHTHKNLLIAVIQLLTWQNINEQTKSLTDAAIISCKQLVPQDYVVVGEDVRGKAVTSSLQIIIQTLVHVIVVSNNATT